VAVLPEPEKVQIDIPESDVKIDVTTAQGPGGQNVNKVATAVTMVHIPTGIEVRMQESKSQQQNRARAWQLMRARVFDHNQRLVNAQRARQRSAMIGSGERSERIRTYRWKENVVVDHRVERSFNLGAVIAGGLEPVVDALIAHDRALRIAAL
jgi:peptide chain release factor 1